MKRMVASTRARACAASGVLGSTLPYPSSCQWWPMAATLKHSHGGLARMMSGFQGRSEGRRVAMSATMLGLEVWV